MLNENELAEMDKLQETLGLKEPLTPTESERRVELEGAAAKLEEQQRLAAARCSSNLPEVQAAAKDVWNVFVKRGISYEQGINIMAAMVKMMGRKTGDEVGAFCAFLNKAIKICPALADVPGKPGESNSPNDKL